MRSIGAEAGAGAAVAERVPPGGLLGWVATTDHKRIALRMALVSFGFFLLGGVFALVM